MNTANHAVPPSPMAFRPDDMYNAAVTPNSNAGG